MDDDLKQLEAELTQLQPAPVSARLMNRLAAELEGTTARRPERRPRERPAHPAAPRVHWLFTFALPAAAVVALSVLPFAGDRGRLERRGNARVPPVLKPIAAQNVLVGATDEGLVTLEDGTPARRARLQFVDTFTWRNPRTNASLTWSVPREEVRVVPISFQ